MKKANSPAHEEVTQRAREIWSARGSPGGCDTEIWLEAERQLATGAPDSNAPERASSRTASDAKGATGFAERAKAETAAESVVEYLISPPVSEEQAVKAALPDFIGMGEGTGRSQAERIKRYGRGGSVA